MGRGEREGEEGSGKGGEGGGEVERKVYTVKTEVC